jgi:hypothetical protein
MQFPGSLDNFGSPSHQAQPAGVHAASCSARSSVPSPRPLRPSVAGFQEAGQTVPMAYRTDPRRTPGPSADDWSMNRQGRLRPRGCRPGCAASRVGNQCGGGVAVRACVCVCVILRPRMSSSTCVPVCGRQPVRVCMCAYVWGARVCVDVRVHEDVVQVRRGILGRAYNPRACVYVRVCAGAAGVCVG